MKSLEAIGDMKNYGMAIRKIRKTQILSQEKFGEKLGITRER